MAQASAQVRISRFFCYVTRVHRLPPSSSSGSHASTTGRAGDSPVALMRMEVAVLSVCDAGKHGPLQRAHDLRGLFTRVQETVRVTRIDHD